MLWEFDKRTTVFNTLSFKQTPVCPYYIWIDEEMVTPLSEHFGEDQFVSTNGTVHTFTGSYSALTEIIAQPVEVNGDYFVDEFGVTFRRGSIPHVEIPALQEPTLENYNFPDLTTDCHFSHLNDWCSLHQDRFRIVQLGMLFFERSWGIRGMQEFFLDLYLHQNFVEDLLDGLEAACHSVIDHLLSNFHDKIDAIGLSEDYGSQSSLLISPESWRKFIKPRIKRLVRHIRQGGKYAYIHSCGNITQVIPDLVEIGVNMLQPIQPEAMNIFELKKLFGQQICLVGGISTQELLQFGTTEQIRSEVNRCRSEMGEGGGYIMAPAKPILPGVPIENAIALIEAMQEE